MVNQVSARKVLTCPNDHQNPDGTDVCGVCGLPVVDYEIEVGLLLKALGELERHVTFETEKVFLGIGDRGCSLIRDFCRFWGSGLKSSQFLMIESSSEAQQAVGPGTEPGSDESCASPLLSLHTLPMSASRQVGYYGLGERLASNDPTLEDSLHRSGIRPLTKNQVVVLLSALGGGTGSGASPNVLQRVRAANPNCRSLVIAVMPAADEPDSAQFNAFCSLSRFVNADEAIPLHTRPMGPSRPMRGGPLENHVMSP